MCTLAVRPGKDATITAPQATRTLQPTQDTEQTPKTLRTRIQASERVLLAPTPPLSDVDLGLILECAMSDPVTRLNAALEGRYRVERELGQEGARS